ncbi:hypothetical protein L7F22_057369 [Adiantum nelumboides]|nr:hypothetical protein [Adiantum nelumboides]
MTKADSPKPLPKLETINLKVFIHCAGCRRKIRRIIRIVDGVEDVVVDSPTGKVTVTGTNLDLKIIQQRLQKYGKQAEVWPSANAASSSAASKSAGGNQPKPAANNASNPADTNSKKKNNAPGGNGGGKPVASASGNESKKGGGKKEEVEQVPDQKGKDIEDVQPSEKKAEKSKPEKIKDSNANIMEAGEPSVAQHNGSDGGNDGGGGGGGGGSGKKGKKGGNGAGNDGSNDGGGGGSMSDHPSYIALDRPIPSIPSYTTSIAVSANKGPASYDYVQTGYAEYNTVDYATNMFSDENANNCSIM